MPFTDEWLAATVQPLLPTGELEKIRSGSQAAPVSLWLTLTERRLATDEQILGAVAKRFRLPLADLSQFDPRVRESVPENLVRRFMVLPLRLTDSYLEVATSNPFDIEAEKLLAFASGREVRMLIASPRRLRDRIDELYRPADEAVQRLLGGLEDAEVTQLDARTASTLVLPRPKPPPRRSCGWWT
jgi:hypothetical protein